MRQKLAIVRALVHNPGVIFLDEPTSGLDPESARAVRDAVAELATEGRTVVLCSHNLAEVERLCKRVAVVKRRLLAVSRIEELRKSGVSLTLTVQGDAREAAAPLSRLPFSTDVLAEGALLRVMMKEEAQAPDVIAALAGAGVRIFSAVPAARPLEEVYLELMREEV
jgi:ABC-2 type transport system ATP-binding protein